MKTNVRIFSIAVVVALICSCSGGNDEPSLMEPAEVKKPEPAFNAEKWAAENRAAALISQAEGDAELANYAQKTREEYKSKAIRFQSTSSGGVTIDSFELPGDVFVACTLSFPGPVYSCDETASANP